MTAELLLSIVNERRLGPLASGLETAARARCSRPPSGRCAPGSRCASRASAAARASTTSPRVLYLAAGLLFRYAWVGAGRLSARDDRAVAEMHRAETHGT